MSQQTEIKHPEICFGISRHNVIIPLKVVDVFDYKDGCFRYTFEVNHPEPSRYMICHQQADFNEKYVSPDSPLCDRFTKVRLTIEEAKEVARKELEDEKAAAIATVNRLNKALADIDSKAAELEKEIFS
jgi:hypothetical protein